MKSTDFTPVLLETVCEWSLIFFWLVDICGKGECWWQISQIRFSLKSIKLLSFERDSLAAATQFSLREKRSIRFRCQQCHFNVRGKDLPPCQSWSHFWQDQCEMGWFFSLFAEESLFSGGWWGTFAALYSFGLAIGTLRPVGSHGDLPQFPAYRSVPGSSTGDFYWEQSPSCLLLQRALQSSNQALCSTPASPQQELFSFHPGVTETTQAQITE